MGKFLK